MSTRRPQRSRRGPLRRIIAKCFSIACWTLLCTVVVAVLSVVAGRKLFDRLDEEIRLHVQAELASRFPDLRVTVRSARRVEGVGIEVQQVLMFEDEKPSPMAEIDSLVLKCTTDLTELATGHPEPTSIELNGVKLQVSQSREGHWSFRKLLPAACRDERERSPIPILIRDLQTTVTTPATRPMKFVDLHVDLLPNYMDDAPYAMWRVLLRTGLGSDELSVVGRLDPCEGSFVASCRTPRQEIRPELLKLAAVLGAPLEDWQIRGVLRDIDSTWWGGPGKPLRYRMSCELRGGRIAHANLPLPLDNVTARLFVDSQQLRVSDGKATAAGASLDLKELFWDRSQRRFRTDLEVANLRVTERLAALAPESLAKSWQQYGAVGEIDRATWTFERSAAEGVVQNQLDLECHDLAFQFPELPYRFHRASGSFAVRGERLAVNLVAPVSGQQVRIVGDVRGLGTPGPYGWLELGTEAAVPLDEEMINALSPAGQRIVRSFQPQGTLKIWGYVHRDGPFQPLQKQTSIRLTSLAVNYETLPYPVGRIEGLVTMQNDNWTFDVAGRNDDAHITCQGTWRDSPPGDEPHLKLSFHGTHVMLDNELRQSLPPHVQRLWHQMRPIGTLDDIQVELEHHALQSRTRTRVSVWKQPPARGENALALSVFIPGLPYRLEQVTGKVVYSDGVTQLEGLRGVHGNANWEAEGRTVCHDDRWVADFKRLVADNLTMDRDLLSCVPSAAAPAIALAQLRGPIDLDGTLTLQGIHGASPPIDDAKWDVTLDIENGSARIGQLPLDKVRGQMRMRGAAKQSLFAINGELNVDSFEVRGTTVHQIKGPLTMDNHSIRLGSWANSHQQRQIQARAFGGVMTGDAEFLLDGSQRFELTASLANGQLSNLARQTVPVGGRVAGQADGTLLLSGSTRGVHTLKGEGYAEMHNADIYEAPVMVSLLQLFSLRENDRSLISNGNTNFRIVGDRIYLDRMELDGAIRLRGTGEMSFQRQLDLTLYTANRSRNGDNWLLFRDPGRSILEIDVAGSLEHPEITRRAFPELNDTLQRLFPDAQRKRAVADNLPLLKRVR